MSLIKIERKRIIENDKCVEIRVYKVLGIPIVRYTYIQRDNKSVTANYSQATGKVANYSDGVPVSILESLERSK